MCFAHRKGSSTRKLSEVFPEQSFMEKDEAIDQVIALDRQTRTRTRAGYPKLRGEVAAGRLSREPPALDRAVIPREQRRPCAAGFSREKNSQSCLPWRAAVLLVFFPRKRRGVQTGAKPPAAPKKQSRYNALSLTVRIG